MPRVDTHSESRGVPDPPPHRGFRDEYIMLNGKNDNLEVDASHLDSRGPLLEARIARG